MPITLPESIVRPSALTMDFVRQEKRLNEETLGTTEKLHRSAHAESIQNGAINTTAQKKMREVDRKHPAYNKLIGIQP